MKEYGVKVVPNTIIDGLTPIVQGLAQGALEIVENATRSVISN